MGSQNWSSLQWPDQSWSSHRWTELDLKKMGGNLTTTCKNHIYEEISDNHGSYANGRFNRRDSTATLDVKADEWGDFNKKKINLADRDWAMIFMMRMMMQLIGIKKWVGQLMRSRRQEQEKEEEEHFPVSLSMKMWTITW